MAALQTMVEADKADLDSATKSVVASAGTATIGIRASLAVALLLAVAQRLPSAARDHAAARRGWSPSST